MRWRSPYSEEDFQSVSSSWDTTHNSSERPGNLFPPVLICHRRALVCLSAVGALQHTGQTCSLAAAARRTTPVPVVPFMVQGPLISTGSCTYFMDTSLHERGGREEEEGGLTQGEADDGLCLFLLRDAGHPLYNRRFWIIRSSRWLLWRGPRLSDRRVLEDAVWSSYCAKCGDRGSPSS